MKRFLSAILVLVSVLAVAYAQPGLDRCKEMARKHYPVIRQYDLISQSQEYSMSNAAKAWLPQVNLSAQATYQSDVASWPDQFESMLSVMGLDMPGLRKDQYKVQIDIQQTIWDGGKSKAEKALAVSEAEQSVRSADVEMYSLDSRIENLYFGILLLQGQKRQIEDMVARLQNNLDYVNALVENGVAMQADADAVEAQMLSSGQNLHQVKASEDSFRRMLELFIGESLGDGNLPVPQAVAPMATDSQRPELLMFDAQIGALEAKNQMLNAALTPKFALFAQGYYGYPGLNMFENMMSSKWSLNGIVGVRMSWNISSFYTDKTSRKQITNAMDRVRLQKDIFTFNTKIQVEQDNAEIRRIRAVLADDDRIVSLRKNVREAAEARLQEGAVDMNDLLSKISDESAAMIARSTHEIELIKAIYDLKYTLNR